MGVTKPTSTAAQAWRGDELVSDVDRWVIRLDERQAQEADAATRAVAAAGVEPGHVAAGDFPLPSWQGLVARVRRELTDGQGFVVLRGLATGALDLHQQRLLVSGLGAHFGFVEPQDAAGALVHDVRDTGRQLLTDGAARGYQTNIRLDFHTDGADVAALLCLATAKEGGESRLVSAATVFEEVRRRAPNLAEVLQQPFEFDNRGQTANPTQAAPVFAWHRGYLNVLYKRGYIELAQRFDHVAELTDAQTAALDLMDAVCEEDGISLDMWLEPGDLQLVNNLAILHSRTEYVDHDEPERRRHLLRLWLTLPEGRPLPPSFARTREYGCIQARTDAGQRREVEASAVGRGTTE